eukprot:2527085-Rhodomonas_salina.2
MVCTGRDPRLQLPTAHLQHSGVGPVVENFSPSLPSCFHSRARFKRLYARWSCENSCVTSHSTDYSRDRGGASGSEVSRWKQALFLPGAFQDPATCFLAQD